MKYSYFIAGYIYADATASFDVKKAFENVHKVLSAKYPGHILPASDLEWVFINAGGLMGSACVLHASLTEYVLFFGTAMDTSGNSGSTVYITPFLCYFILAVVFLNFCKNNNYFKRICF